MKDETTQRSSSPEKEIPRAGNFSIVLCLAAGESVGHAPISSSVRRHPRQYPAPSMAHIPVQGVAAAE